MFPRSALALLSALVLALVPATSSAFAADQTATRDVHRITGSDAFSVAAAAAQEYPSGQAVTFIVNVDAHPDAMVAATRAGGINAPILLVKPTAIPAATQQALNRLDSRRIVVVGGTAVVSESVREALGSYATSGAAERVSGINRYVTSAELATKFDPGASTVYLAGGHGFPDAMAGAALAGYQNVPMTLTPQDRLHPATRTALQHLRPDRIVVLGGTAAVSAKVAGEAAAYSTSGTVQRLSGADRYSTAAQIAANFPSSSRAAYVASGTAYPEALVAATSAGRSHSPLLLVRPTSVPTATETALRRLSLGSIYAVGTRASVSDAVVRDLGSGTTPTPPPAPPQGDALLGGYLGAAHEQPDQRFRNNFGAWPELASTYYQAHGRGGGTINRSYEQARVDRGTIPVLTVTSVNGPYSMSQIGSGAADPWIDYWADELSALDGEVWFTFDHEFEVKMNQGKFSSSTTTQQYVKAFNRFQQRVKSKAPKVKFIYWYGYSDTEKINAIGSGLNKPDMFAIDPYVFDHHAANTSFEKMAQPKLSWLRSRSWYQDQPIIFGEFAKDTQHGEEHVEDFLTDLRPVMEDLGLHGALYFSRDKPGDILADLTSGSWPDAREAFSDSVTP